MTGPHRTGAGHALTDPVETGGVELANRLYRAPLLECAGNRPNAVETLVDELEPTAAAGAGLVFQRASIVTPEWLCGAERDASTTQSSSTGYRR